MGLFLGSQFCSINLCVRFLCKVAIFFLFVCEVITILIHESTCYIDHVDKKSVFRYKSGIQKTGRLEGNLFQTVKGQSHRSLPITFIGF